jgi:hypothetical protein
MQPLNHPVLFFASAYHPGFIVREYLYFYRMASHALRLVRFRALTPKNPNFSSRLYLPNQSLQNRFHLQRWVPFWQSCLSR